MHLSRSVFISQPMNKSSFDSDPYLQIHLKENRVNQTMQHVGLVSFALLWFIDFYFCVYVTVMMFPRLRQL